VEGGTGRQLRGVVLKTRLSNRGYVLVNIRNAAGEVTTRTIHTLVLEAFAGPARPGEEACHWNDDPADNRWPENLRWGTKAENLADRMRNSPAAPKAPPKPCVRCGGKVDKGGRRCHACVVEIGVEAAVLLDEGVPLDQVADKLDYPHLPGLHTLARKYGGYAQQPPPRQPLSQRVIAAARRLLGRGDTA
jgi:HNH endonuclease